MKNDQRTLVFFHAMINSLENLTVYFQYQCYDYTMDIPLAERRQIENEMIFRRANENVGDALDEVDAAHIEEGYPEFIRTTDPLLHFKCECSDEDCDARLPMKLSVYQEIHENRDAFVIKHKHQVKEIEKVITTEDDYSVVEKNNSIAEPGNNLNKTATDNS